MAKQASPTDAQSTVDSKAAQSPTPAPESGEIQELAAPQLSLQGTGDLVARLKRLSPSQQHAMLSHINRKYGHQHAQRLGEAIHKRDQGGAAGNGEATLQSKLTVGAPDDAYEQEADQVADAVMRAPASSPPADDSPSSPSRGGGSARAIWRALADGSDVPEVAPDVETSIQSLRGGGDSLPDEERSFFEERMGSDFSGVRIHADGQAAESAQSLQARAFTVGNDIFFNENEYQPGTTEGRHLLGHELTHVVQQGASAPLQRKLADEPEVQEAAPAPTPAVGEGTAEAGQAESAGAEAAPAVVPTPAAPPQVEATPPLEPAPEGEMQAANETLAQESQGMIDQLSGVATPGADAPPPAAPEAEAAPDPTALAGEVLAESAATRAEMEAGDQEADTAVQAATGLLQEAGARASGLGSLRVEFAEEILPPQAPAPDGAGILVQRREMADTGADPDFDWEAYIAEQRALAQSMINDFLGGNSARVQRLTALAQQVPGPIMQAANEAKGKITSRVEAQKALLSGEVTRVKGLVTTDTETLEAQITSDYEGTVAQIKEQTGTARQQVEDAYARNSLALTFLVREQLRRVDDLYQGTEENYIKAKERVIAEAGRVGGEKEKSYRSLVRNPKVNDSFLDGPLTDNRNEARADAAQQVTADFKKSLEKTATEQIAEAMKSHPDVVKRVQDEVPLTESALKKGRESTLRLLDESERTNLDAAREQKASLDRNVKQMRQEYLRALTEHQTIQLQVLEDEGAAQKSAIDQLAKQATALMQQAVTQKIQEFTSGQESLAAGLQGMETPDPEALGPALDNAAAQLENAITTAQMQVQGELAKIQEKILAAGEQGSETIDRIGEDSREPVASVESNVTRIVGQIQEAATRNFTKLEEDHTKAVTDSASEGVKGLDGALEALSKKFDTLNENMREQFSQTISKFEQGLMDSVHQGSNALIPQIEKSAEEAASQVQPRWKSVLKWVAIIAVVVVCAFVLGPFLVGALGTVFGSSLLGVIAANAIAGAITGGLMAGSIQVIRNAHDGKALFDNFWTEVGWGALGGFLAGGLSTALGLGAKAVGFSQVRQMVGQVIGDIAGNVTAAFFSGGLSGGAAGENLLIIVMGAIGGKVLAHKIPARYRSSTGGSSQSINDAMESAGAATTNRIRNIASGSGPAVDAPTGTGIDVDVPTSTRVEVEAPSSTSTEVEAPSNTTTEVEAPSNTTTEVEAPSNTTTEVEAPANTGAEAEAPTPVEPKSGTQIAADRGYPPAPQGYHWVRNGDDAFIRRNPGSNKPPLRYDKSSGAFVEVE